MHKRVRAMLVGWGSVGAVYWSCQLMQRPGQFLPETILDDTIGFHPWAVWLYLGFFVMVPCAYLFSDLERVPVLLRSMQVCAMIAGLCYLVWPSTLHYPVIAGEGPSATVLRLLMRWDCSQNCLPSLHAALTLLSVCALWYRGQWYRKLWALSAGVSIVWAIIATRRHLSIDVGAGLILAALVQSMIKQVSLPLRARNHTGEPGHRAHRAYRASGETMDSGAQVLTELRQ